MTFLRRLDALAYNALLFLVLVAFLIALVPAVLWILLVLGPLYLLAKALVGIM